MPIVVYYVIQSPRQRKKYRRSWTGRRPSLKTKRVVGKSRSRTLLRRKRNKKRTSNLTVWMILSLCAVSIFIWLKCKKNEHLSTCNRKKSLEGIKRKLAEAEEDSEVEDPGAQNNQPAAVESDDEVEYYRQAVGQEPDEGEYNCVINYQLLVLLFNLITDKHLFFFFFVQTCSLVPRGGRCPLVNLQEKTETPDHRGETVQEGKDGSSPGTGRNHLGRNRGLEERHSEQRKLAIGRRNLVERRDLKGTKHLVGIKTRTSHSDLKVRKPSRALRREVQERSKASNRGKEKAELFIPLSGLGHWMCYHAEHQVAARRHLPSMNERPIIAENQHRDKGEQKCYIFHTVWININMYLFNKLLKKSSTQQNVFISALRFLGKFQELSFSSEQLLFLQDISRL